MVCKVCKEVKDLKDFQTQPSTYTKKSGETVAYIKVNHTCRQCTAAKQKVKRQRNPEKLYVQHTYFKDNYYGY